MLKYKVGDLLEAAKSGEVDVIAHCCNCYCSMASGIAPKIRWAFPYAYAADCATETADASKLGGFSLGEPEYYPNPLVYNLYGQFGFWKRQTGGRDLDYNALYDALLAMGQDLHRFDTGEYEKHRIGLPMIGAGLAGGDWDIIELMIQKTLVEAGHDVTIYKLK